VNAGSRIAPTLTDRLVLGYRKSSDGLGYSAEFSNSACSFSGG
jgi:hypothetical protein